MEGFGSARVGKRPMEAPNETRRRPRLLFPDKGRETALRTLEKGGRHCLDLWTAPSSAKAFKPVRRRYNLPT
jgi:hypothetical protein